MDVTADVRARIGARETWARQLAHSGMESVSASKPPGDHLTDCALVRLMERVEAIEKRLAEAEPCA